MEYKYTEDDVLTKHKEAEEHKGKKGWFSDNLSKVYDNAKEGVKSHYYGEMCPSGSKDSPFEFMKKGYCYRYFCPEHEPSYAELQAEWVKENGIKEGDKVKVLSIWKNDPPFCGSANVSVGDVLEVEELLDNRILVHAKVGFVSAPYTCLEKITEPKFMVGDWVKSRKTGAVYKVEAVCIDKLYGDVEKGLYVWNNDAVRVHFEPFDLSSPEVRKSLHSKWVKNTEDEAEEMLWSFELGCRLDKEEWTANDQTGEELLENFVFEDGAPVGKEVTE